MSVNVRIAGLDTTLNTLRTVVSGMAAELYKACKDGAQMVKKDTQALTPVRTGKMKRGVGYRKYRKAYGIGYYVKAKMQATHLIEHGTKRGVKAKLMFDKASRADHDAIKALIEKAVGRAVKTL